MPADRPETSDYRLERAVSIEDWKAFHDIRRRVFSLPRSDEDLGSDCHPLLLFLGNRPVGAIQVDNLGNDRAALRLVAIDPSFQGGGHGRAMLERAESFVRDLGCGWAVVYATPEAAGFYQSLGYDEEDWDEFCMGGIVQMQKAVR